MKKIAVLSLILFAAGVGTSLSSVVRAEDQPAASSSDTTPAPKSDRTDTKDGNGMKMDGMGKMEGMGKMMENCDKMMQSKMDDKGKTDSSKTGRGC